jgi:hypothetical protein
MIEFATLGAVEECREFVASVMEYNVRVVRVTESDHIAVKRDFDARAVRDAPVSLDPFQIVFPH